MKSQNLILATLVLAMLLLPMMSAAITLTSPTARSNLSSTINFGVTKLIDDEPVNATNVTLWYAQVGGSLQMLSGSKIINDSRDDLSFSLTGISLSGLSDGLYNFTYRIANETFTAGFPANVTLRIDQTKPTVTISSDVTQISEKRAAKITWTSSDTYLNTTNVSIVSPNTVRCPSQEFSDANSNTVYMDQETICAGYYTATITATDYSGNSATATVQFRVTAPDGKFIGEKTIQPISDKTAQRNVGIGIVIIILVVMFFNRKK